MLVSCTAARLGWSEVTLVTAEPVHQETSPQYSPVSLPRHIPSIFFSIPPTATLPWAALGSLSTQPPASWRKAFVRQGQEQLP
jgi:hypothetical protein